MEYLSNHHKEHPIQSKAVQRNGASPFEFEGKAIETETTTQSEFSNGEKAIVEQILRSEEITKFKRAGLGVPDAGIRVQKLTIRVRSFITEFISSTRIC